MRFRTLVPICLGIGLWVTAPAWGDDLTQVATDTAPAVTTANVPQTLQLGAIDVHGKLQVARVLLTIRKALKAPDSTDQAHRGDLVCRFVHDIADPRTYLDCATNATNMARRANTQMARLTPVCTATKCDSSGDQQSMLESLVAKQPGERLHMLVNPGQFRQMMDEVKELPAAVTASAPATAAAPAAVTHTIE